MDQKTLNMSSDRTTPSSWDSDVAWTGLSYMLSLHEVCVFQTREGARVGPASNSEMRRWLKNGVLRINGKTIAWDEVIDYPIQSVTLFSKKNKVTLL